MSNKNKPIGRSIIVGPWYFKIRIYFTIFTLAVIAILIYLGSWQLLRSIQKREKLTELKQMMQEKPMLLTSIEEPKLIKDRFKPVLMQVIFLNKYTFLLDNQVYNGQVGYRVLTVTQSPYLHDWLLVDRGWIAQGKSRNELPVIKDIYGLQDLVGIINTIPYGIKLGEYVHDDAAPWPRVIQTLDYKDVAKTLNHPVYDFVLQLNPKDPLAYDMPPVEFGLPSNKHLTYALQWYSFALLMLIYYCIGTFSKKED